jgi:S1-C subfamily serine protease
VRPAALAVVSLVSAGVGAVGVLGIANAAGWIGGSNRTVVITQTVGGSAAAAHPLAPTRPLTGNGFDPAAIYTRRSPGVVTIFAYFGAAGGSAAQGSGFVVSPRGYVLTNSHVITSAGDATPGGAEAASSIYVEFADHDRVPAKIVGWDVFDDVGLIRVEPNAHRLVPLPLGDSSSVRVGEPVAAIGSPFGNENSLTVGVVSATHRSIGSLTSSYDLVDAIQVDAPINHGNSGGPLFDARGDVIGINAQIRSESGNAEGVGFALPIDAARRSMTELIATGRVRYAYVGITTEDLTPTLARHLRLPVRHGALVDSVLPGSPGAKAGLRGGRREEDFNGGTFIGGGDVIVAIGGVPVRGSEDVVRIVAERLKPRERTTFTVLREGRRIALPVLLAERPLSQHIRR